jgi:hypothetical protein
MTIELLGVLPGGDDLVLSDQSILKVKDGKRILMIKK